MVFPCDVTTGIFFDSYQNSVVTSKMACNRNSSDSSESSHVEDSEGSDGVDDSEEMSVPVGRGLLPYQHEPRRQQGQQQQDPDPENFFNREVRIGNNEW